MGTHPLSRISYFSRLTEPELAALESRLIEKRFAKGDTLFQEGDPATGLWIMRSGRVSILRSPLNGMTLLTEAFREGEVFCPMPLLDGKPYPCTATAAADCVMWYMPGADFLAVLRRSAPLTQATFGYVADRLRYYEDAHAGGQSDVTVRVARAILQMRAKFGDTIRLTRTELAQMAGTTMESAYRTTSKFARQGLIKTGRGSLTILKPLKLTQIAQGS